MASSVIELGMRLLEEITEPPQQPAKKTSSVELDGVCDVSWLSQTIRASLININVSACVFDLQKKTAASHDEGPSEQLKVLEVMKTRITETLRNRDVTSCNKTGPSFFFFSLMC